MKEALIQLLKIKSLVTLVMVILFAVLAYQRVISSENTYAMIAVVLTYYFNKKDSDGSTPG